MPVGCVPSALTHQPGVHLAAGVPQHARPAQLSNLPSRSRNKASCALGPNIQAGLGGLGPRGHQLLHRLPVCKQNQPRPGFHTSPTTFPSSVNANGCWQIQRRRFLSFFLSPLIKEKHSFSD